MIGDLRLLEVTTEVVESLKAEIPRRVQADRPSVEGRYATNHALRQGKADQLKSSASIGNACGRAPCCPGTARTDSYSLTLKSHSVGAGWDLF